MAEGSGPVDITRAALRRAGNDVTLIAYGGTLRVALEAAEALASAGIEADVIDLRTLRPLDDETIVESVRRTHRAVVVDEGWRSGSISAEITARIVEHAFFDLDAPVERVCSAEVPDAVRAAPRGGRAPHGERGRGRRPASCRPWLSRASSACRHSAPT